MTWSDEGATTAAGERPGGERGQFLRVARHDGAPVELSFDGEIIPAVAGQSVLAALLAHRRVLRHSEFDGAPRAGFCLMGACQDCWVWSDAGGRLRACTTPVAEGMVLASRPSLAALASHG